MAEESGFFSSVDGDRKFNADFMNRKLYAALQRSDGILPYGGTLAVSLVGNYGTTIDTGEAIKGGIYYRNTETISLTRDYLVNGNFRIDRVVVHINRLERTMSVKIIKGQPSYSIPEPPEYSEEDDILLAQILLKDSGLTSILTDERQMMPVFLTDKDSLDDISDGQVYGRLLKEKAETFNAGILDLSLRKFIYAAKAWSDSRIVKNIIQSPNGSYLLMATTLTNKLWISYTLGVTWIAQPGELDNYYVRKVSMNGTTIFAFIDNHARIFKGSLSGPWSLVAENQEYSRFQTFLAVDNLILLAGCEDLLYRSTDGGITWTMQYDFPNMDFITSIERLDNGILLAAGTGSKYIFISTDSGITWNQGPEIYDYSSGDMVIKNLGNGIVITLWDSEDEILRRSTDYGMTWEDEQVIDTVPYIPSIVIDGNKIYMAISTRIYSSKDNGATWIKETDVGNIDEICEMFKCKNEIIVTIGYDGFITWGYPINA